MKMKRFFAMLLAMLMLAGILAPVKAQAATSGKCGTNVKWSWDGKGTLTISGTGAMKNYVFNAESSQLINYPWWNFKEKITKIVIKDGVTSIGNNAFAYVNGEYDEETGTTKTFSVVIPPSVKKIGEGAFQWCSLNIINIPDTVTEIGRASFLTCQFATSIKISKNLKTIPQGAFSQCPKLTSVTIPSGVTKIESAAFSYNENLKTLTIPASVKTIEPGAFYSDSGHKITTIIFKGTKSAWNKLTAEDYNGNMLTSAKNVYCKPGVTTPVTLVVAAAGNKASMSVKATGKGLYYQWYYKKPGSTEWLVVSKNGTSATCSLTTATKHNGYVYRCKVTNKAGTTFGKEITLLTAKPKITSFPTSVTTREGKAAIFKVEAIGATRYQWQYRKPGGSWTNVVSNGTSATYKLTTEPKHDGYSYRCKVSNSLGTTITDRCKLTVY